MMAPDSDSVARSDEGLIVSREIYRFKELVSCLVRFCSNADGFSLRFFLKERGVSPD